MRIVLTLKPESGENHNREECEAVCRPLHRQLTQNLSGGAEVVAKRYGVDLPPRIYDPVVLIIISCTRAEPALRNVCIHGITRELVAAIKKRIEGECPIKVGEEANYW